MSASQPFARSSHSTRALVDRRVANASNPKDISVGLTVDQVQFTKSFIVDALLVRVGGEGGEGAGSVAMTREHA